MQRAGQTLPCQAPSRPSCLPTRPSLNRRCNTRSLAGKPDSPQAIVFLTPIIDEIMGVATDYVDYHAISDWNTSALRSAKPGQWLSGQTSRPRRRLPVIRCLGVMMHRSIGDVDLMTRVNQLRGPGAVAGPEPRTGGIGISITSPGLGLHVQCSPAGTVGPETPG